MYKIKVVKETACLMITKDGEYVDSMFINHYDFEDMTMDQIEFEASKLAAINEVKEYVFDARTNI